MLLTVERSTKCWICGENFMLLSALSRSWWFWGLSHWTISVYNLVKTRGIQRTHAYSVADCWLAIQFTMSDLRPPQNTTTSWWTDIVYRPFLNLFTSHRRVCCPFEQFVLLFLKVAKKDLWKLGRERSPWSAASRRLWIDGGRGC